MAVSWDVSTTKGLGSNYKTCVKSGANSYGAGSLYQCKRLSDGSGYHRWHCYVKKLLGKKGEFIFLSHKAIDGTEAGSGYISVSNGRVLSPGDPLP